MKMTTLIATPLVLYNFVFGLLKLVLVVYGILALRKYLNDSKLPPKKW